MTLETSKTPIGLSLKSKKDKFDLIPQLKLKPDCRNEKEVT